LVLRCRPSLKYVQNTPWRKNKNKKNKTPLPLLKWPEFSRWSKPVMLGTLEVSRYFSKGSQPRAEVSETQQ
jgi:hypothetical protein